MGRGQQCEGRGSAWSGISHCRPRLWSARDPKPHTDSGVDAIHQNRTHCASVDGRLGSWFESCLGKRVGLEPLAMNPADPLVHTSGERLDYRGGGHSP